MVEGDDTYRNINHLGAQHSEAHCCGTCPQTRGVDETKKNKQQGYILLLPIEVVV